MPRPCRESSSHSRPIDAADKSSKLSVNTSIGVSFHDDGRQGGNGFRRIDLVAPRDGNAARLIARIE